MDKNRRKNGKKIVCAISGGLDSAVAAALLKRDQFNVIGVFLKFWSESEGAGKENRCCSSESEIRARKVAEILKIPFYVFDFSREFKRKIVERFLGDYKKGLTPNPCVVCNKEIKFGLLLEKTLKIKADFIATGHYARKKENFLNSSSDIGKFSLLKAKDKEKDQSYFLWMLNQEQLKRILFPIGDYKRSEVEGLARKFKLPVLKAKKSVEICFVEKTVNDFLSKYLKEKPGKIIDNQGKILGEHKGLWFYTIGQRKGIGLSGGPFWVIGKDLKRNILIVTKNEKDLLKKELIFKDVNWISGKEPKLPLKIKAKIRYRHRPASAMIYKLKDKIYHLKFLKPQRAITPGQSVVFYKKNQVIGGGIII